jgi:hypothetical protein
MSCHGHCRPHTKAEAVNDSSPRELTDPDVLTGDQDLRCAAPVTRVGVFRPGGMPAKPALHLRERSPDDGSDNTGAIGASCEMNGPGVWAEIGWRGSPAMGERTRIRDESKAEKDHALFTNGAWPSAGEASTAIVGLGGQADLAGMFLPPAGGARGTSPVQ